MQGGEGDGTGNTNAGGFSQWRQGLESGFSGLSIPQLSKFIAVVLTCFYVANWAIPHAQIYFGLVPGNTMTTHFYIWSFVTAGYFEVSLMSWFMDAIAILFIGKFFEPLWGSKEYLKFILLVNSITGFICFLLLTVLYHFSEEPPTELWLESSVHGFGGVLGAFTIALKQQLPEHQINLLCAPVKAKYFPGLLFVLNLIFLIFGMYETAPFTLVGLCVAWVYLRFFKVSQNTRGDWRENFEFKSFFPESLHPTVSVISSGVFNLFSLCGCLGSPPSVSVSTV